MWCYECDEEINITAKKKLLETVENLRKMADNKKKITDRPSLPNLGEAVGFIMVSFVFINEKQMKIVRVKISTIICQN